MMIMMMITKITTEKIISYYQISLNKVKLSFVFCSISSYNRQRYIVYNDNNSNDNNNDNNNNDNNDNDNDDDNVNDNYNNYYDSHDR